MLTAAALGAVLAACASTEFLDRLEDASPVGSPFAQALFAEYSRLALYLDDEGETTAADELARKALAAARGREIGPEPAGGELREVRNQIVTALDAGARTTMPQLAAKAQASLDCWFFAAREEASDDEIEPCRADAIALAAQMGTTAPAPAPVQVQTNDFTVYFGWNEWVLTAEALGVIDQAMNTARTGGQSRISIEGHTDTSGSASYNQGLSERRAMVVRDVMVTQGARPDAISVSGFGETRPAVSTGDGVREARNRRSVILLIP